MKMPQSNKARGAVKIDTASGSPSPRSSANPQRAEPNQAQGPRSGNHGTPTKQKSFLAEKSDRSSYFKELADMVSNAFGARGRGMQPNQPNPPADQTATRSISPTTRTKRGPTRGNQ
jgi:hypothetical protein